MSKKSRWAKFLWPSQNIWTLRAYTAWILNESLWSLDTCLYSILLLWLYGKMVLHCLEFFRKLYISHCPKEPSCFLWKRSFFLSGFKGTGNWLPFLSQARNTRCIRNDNSIQKYMSNWITHKNPNLTVHTYKEGFDILSYLSQVLKGVFSKK